MVRQLDLEKRMDIVERDLRDHAKTLSAHTDTIKMVEVRTTAIEDARRARAIEEVRREEREEARSQALNVRLDSIVKDITSLSTDVKGIRGTGVKLGWIVITAVTLAVVGWLLKGGTVVP